jgi:K+-transporting ATPase ATPase A chain
VAGTNWPTSRLIPTAPAGPRPTLIGRFGPIILALAIAGSLAGARVHARTRATLDTAGATFAGFLAGVIVIVGGLIYFPMLILGPIGERITG